MSESDRPPLDPRVYDLIELSLYGADQRHWDQLAPMQVTPQQGPPTSLPAPKLRVMLLNRLEVYAGDLFKLEADQYSEFKSRADFPAYLSRLGDRVIARVFKTIEILERANSPATLAYHGLTDDEIRADLKRMLWDMGNYYIWQDVGSQASTQTVQSVTPTTAQQPAPVPISLTIAQQLKDLQRECDISAEKMAEALGVDPRSIYKHLAGQTVPRRDHVAAYENLFSERLKRSVILKRSVKSQITKSKRS